VEAVKVLKKIVNSFGYIGAAALFFGLVGYSVGIWALGSRVAVYGGVALLVLYLLSSVGKLGNFLRSRGGKQGSVAGLTTILVIGIIVLLNFLSYRHSERIDLTENQIHSLSEQSRKLVEGLEADVNVLGFFVDPSAAEQFENLMKEYRFVSDRLSFEVVDPQEDISLATQYEIDRASQIVVVSGGRTQKADATTESAVTNALIKVTREQEKVVYFLEGHGERDLDEVGEEGYQAVRKAVEQQNYRVQSYNLAVEGRLPEDATVLVSAGPQGNFLPHEVELLDQYMGDGGKLLLMVDPETGFQMDEFLNRYGVQMDNNVVIDVNPLGRLFGLGPAAPLVSTFAQHPVTEDLDITSYFPLSQGITVVDSELGYSVQELFSSSENSWGETELKEGDEVGFNEDVDQPGPVTLSVVATRSVESPENPDSEDTEDSVELTSDLPTESRLVVVGDSDFIANRFLSVGGGNADLFLNMVSWLAEDTELVAIRPKDPTNRQVTLSQRDSRLLFWGTVILLPLITLILGLSVWIRRR
jgi:ABC-type uncharacterized transport system involved in gliding motility auxiliary subunit